MKINEAIDLINRTTTVAADSICFDKTLAIYAKGHLSVDHFLSMSVDTKAWDNVNFDPQALYDVVPQDLARVMDVVQQLLDTPVKERFPEKKYRLRWLDSEDIGLGTDTFLGRCHDSKGRGKYWTTFNRIGTEVFTESELEKFKHDNPRLAPAIDAMKEPAEEADDND